MDWPENKDGELLRRLQRDGINLSQPHTVEFNVDFDHWPPPADVLTLLKEKYGNLKLFEPGFLHEMQEGYASLKIVSEVSYDFVINTQREITDEVHCFGGYCNSWAILLHHAET